MRLLHSQGIAGLTPGVLTQLRAKHPERQHTVPTVLPAMQHAAPSVSLRETFSASGLCGGEPARG